MLVKSDCTRGFTICALTQKLMRPQVVASTIYKIVSLKTIHHQCGHQVLPM